jgi:hypothetical protein
MGFVGVKKMFRSTNRAAGFARPTQGTRVIALEDLDLPTENVEHKVQLNGNTTALFVEAYKQEKGPKIIEGYVPKGYPKPISPAAAWAKAESDLAIVRELYNRTLSVVETQKFLQRVYTPQSYLPASVASIAQATIAQAASVVRPPGTQVPSTQVPETKPPSTQPPGAQPPAQPVVQPPGAQPPGSAAPVVQPPGAQPVVQPPGSAAPVVQPPGSAAPVVQPPGSAAPVVQPPGSAQPPAQPVVQPPGAQPPATVTSDTYILAELRKIVPSVEFSNFLVLDSYDQTTTSSPLNVPSTVSTDSDALVARINAKVYQNVNADSARGFTATMLSGGFSEVFQNFNETLKNTPQYNATVTMLKEKYTGLADVPQLHDATYLMTVFYLLLDDELVVPSPEELGGALSKAVAYIRFGIKHMCVYVITGMLSSPAMLVNEARNIVGMQQELNSEVVIEEGKNVTDFRVKYTPPALTFPAPVLSAIYTFSDYVAQLLTMPSTQTVTAVIVALVATTKSESTFFRALSLGSVFFGAFIFGALLPLSVEYSIDIASAILAQLVVFNCLNAFYRGFVSTVTDSTMLLTAFPGTAIGEGPSMVQPFRETHSEAIRLSIMSQATELRTATASRERVVSLTAELIARTLYHVLRQRYPAGNVAESASMALTAARYIRFRDASGVIQDLSVRISGNRVKLRDNLALLLSSFGFDASRVAEVIGKMSPGDRFKFRDTSMGTSEPSDELYGILSDEFGEIKQQIEDFIDAYFDSSVFQDSGVSIDAARKAGAIGWASRLGLNDSARSTREKWVKLLSSMYGVSVATLLSWIQGAAAESDSDSGTIIGETGDGSRPGEEGTARAVSVPTPQYTDAPPSITLEAAMDLLQDNTNSVEQITRSRAPDSYKWVLVKYRRKSLRALWYAVFVGLGIPETDATQALNFLTPTFVDASKNLNEYSGIRTNGAHGVYPRLDQFFTRNRGAINKDFASRSPQIRVKYAAVFFSRFFGLRGKYYAKDLFALSTTELSQAAQLSRIAIDVLQMDATHSDGQPPAQMPTAADLRGYRTGPDDFTNKIIVN